MKKVKFVSVVITLLIVLWASNAMALPGGAEIETLHFDLVLGQQGLLYSNSAPNTTVSTINSVRITDNDLLNFLAEAFHTNWPAGAQFALVNESSIILIHETHVFIVDKTGTNLLFDATTGINIGGTNTASFSFDYDNPVVTGKSVSSPPFLDQTTVQMVNFRLSCIDGHSLTSLNFQGLDISQENYDRSTLSYSITDNSTLYGDGNFNGSPWGVVSGEMSGAFVVVPNLVPVPVIER